MANTYPPPVAERIPNWEPCRNRPSLGHAKATHFRDCEESTLSRKYGETMYTADVPEDRSWVASIRLRSSGSTRKSNTASSKGFNIRSRERGPTRPRGRFHSVDPTELRPVGHIDTSHNWRGNFRGTNCTFSGARQNHDTTLEIPRSASDSDRGRITDPSQTAILSVCVM